ncbi:hypothetical protein WA016_06011 [Myxococcus stipitatus]
MPSRHFSWSLVVHGYLSPGCSSLPNSRPLASQSQGTWCAWWGLQRHPSDAHRRTGAQGGDSGEVPVQHPGSSPVPWLSRTSCDSPLGRRQTRQAAGGADTAWEWKRCTYFLGVRWAGWRTVARRLSSWGRAWRAREHDAPPARRPVLRCMAATSDDRRTCPPQDASCNSNCVCGASAAETRTAPAARSRSGRCACWPLGLGGHGGWPPHSAPLQSQPGRRLGPGCSIPWPCPPVLIPSCG